MVDYKKAIGCVLEKTKCSDCTYRENCAEKVKKKNKKKK
jgi:hypothetical protein